MSSRGSGRGLRHPLLVFGAVGVALVAVVVLAITLIFGGDDTPAYSYGVQTFDDQLEPYRERGASPSEYHLPAGQTYDEYNSNPPTSGPHGPAVEWGFHDEPVAKESAVHNMEHGGVVIWYNCRATTPPLDESTCDAIGQQLAAITNAALQKHRLVMTTQYADMDSFIALTAWTVLDTLTAVDPARIEAFIARYDRAYNPEGF